VISFICDPDTRSQSRRFGLPSSLTDEDITLPVAGSPLRPFRDDLPGALLKEPWFLPPGDLPGGRSYLWCGGLTQGFARVRCPDCHREYLLAFSCRGRWFCPACHAKKVVQFGEQLRGNILYPLPHRQYVFSIPIILRKFFLYNRNLLSTFSKAAAENL
jgi:transposase-like protein